MMHISKVPKNADFITSHVFYKVNKRNASSLKKKERICPHVNKESEKLHLKAYSALNLPTLIRTLLSLETIFKYFVTKIDFKSAFLKTGYANRDLHVVLSRKSDNKNHYWLFLTAKHGLLNVGVKLQQQSDELLKSMGMIQLMPVK